MICVGRIIAQTSPLSGHGLHEKHDARLVRVIPGAGHSSGTSKALHTDRQYYLRREDTLPISPERSINNASLEKLGYAMKISSPILRWLTLAIFSLFSGPAFAGAGGFLVPAHYHPLDNIWKILLTIAVIWIIVRMRRPA